MDLRLKMIWFFSGHYEGTECNGNEGGGIRKPLLTIRQLLFSPCKLLLITSKILLTLLLTISNILLNFYIFQHDFAEGANWEEAGREHTLQLERGFLSLLFLFYFFYLFSMQDRFSFFFCHINRLS